MVDNVIGFLWGVLSTIIVFDICSVAITLHWYVYLPIILLIILGTILGKVYILFTSYQDLMGVGWSFSKYVYMRITHKLKKNEADKQ